MSGTIPRINIVTVGCACFSADLVKRSCCEPWPATPCSFGENSKTTAASTASTAPFSEMSRATKAATSFDKRMQLLMQSGLVAGITPTSTRKRYGQQTLDIAFSQLGGVDAEQQRKGS
jgi:hypothetical protein